MNAWYVREALVSIAVLTVAWAGAVLLVRACS